MTSKREWRKRALAAEKARTDDYLHATVHEAEHEGLAEMARHLLAENSSLWDDWGEEHALTLKWRKRARTEKAERKRCQEDVAVLRQSSVVVHNATAEHLAQINALSEGEAAALNKGEELRRDNIRLATKLARVQGICDSDNADADRERNKMEVLIDDLLAWQRRVREAWDAHLKYDQSDYNLRLAIESDEPKEAESLVGQVTEHWEDTPQAALEAARKGET
jgi:hypothetical protein